MLPLNRDHLISTEGGLSSPKATLVSIVWPLKVGVAGRTDAFESRMIKIAHNNKNKWSRIKQCRGQRHCSSDGLVRNGVGFNAPTLSVVAKSDFWRPYAIILESRLVHHHAQLKDLGGLKLPGAEPGQLLPKLDARSICRPSPAAFAVGAGSATLIFLLRRLLPNWPGMLIAVVLASVVAWMPICRSRPSAAI